MLFVKAKLFYATRLYSGFQITFPSSYCCVAHNITSSVCKLVTVHNSIPNGKCSVSAHAALTMHSTHVMWDLLLLSLKKFHFLASVGTLDFLKTKYLFGPDLVSVTLKNF